MIKYFFLPHPPIIYDDTVKEIKKVRDEYMKIGEEIDSINPDLVIVISPHLEYNSDSFSIIDNDDLLIGNLTDFKLSHPNFNAIIHKQICEAIYSTSIKNEINIFKKKIRKIDHGSVVPLGFIKCRKIVLITISSISLYEHYLFGLSIKEALQKFSHYKIVIIASGDTSHKLKHDGPYGYSINGEKFDNGLIDNIKKNNLRYYLTAKVNNDAAECGLRPLIILYGIMGCGDISSKIHFYDKPFGVGYLISSFEVLNTDSYVDIARNTVNEYILHNKIYDKTSYHYND
jgi:aromatic ring-opening dioxygenase LigB subunit